MCQDGCGQKKNVLVQKQNYSKEVVSKDFTFY